MDLSYELTSDLLKSGFKEKKLKVLERQRRSEAQRASEEVKICNYQIIKPGGEE